MGCVDAYAADAPNSVAFGFYALIISIVIAVVFTYLAIASKLNTNNFLLSPLVFPYNLTITLLLLHSFCPSIGVHNF